jgi:hypothetical protein
MLIVIDGKERRRGAERGREWSAGFGIEVDGRQKRKMMTRREKKRNDHEIK